MVEPVAEFNEQEKQLRNEMLFTLSDRDSGTLALIVTVNEKQRRELYTFLERHLQEYQFYDLDLTPHSYTSLYRALQELLPPEIKQSEPVQYVVSIKGLENSLYKTKDGQVEFSPLIAQLNFERELLFKQPYIILLWVNEGFDWELRKKAPDLMHWLSKRFVFEGEAEKFEVAEETIAYGEVKKKGKIPEREERIKQLLETLEKLSLHHEDKARLIIDKINLLLLLGKEYRTAFYFEKAEDAFTKAITLNNRIEAGMDARLFFELATTYLTFNKYDLALLNYHKALEWYQKTGNEYGFGNTYHQLGMVYAAQRKWKASLENYGKALEWYQKTGNEYGFGNTYHQLGRVYEEQNEFNKAIDFFDKAIKNLSQFEHPGLDIAKASLQRVQDKVKARAQK